MIYLGADIALRGIIAQMLGSRHSLFAKTLCKYSSSLKKGYLLYQTGERPPLLGAESFSSAAVYLRALRPVMQGIKRYCR